MTRRPHTLDQFTDAGGSCTQLDTMNPADESAMLGRAVAGQSGSGASISSFAGGFSTITGLSGMTSLSVGRYVTFDGADTAGNNGTFLVTQFVSSSSVIVENASGVSPDANNGSITWTEREPYSLEDDLNYRRTAERLIKGTPVWYNDLPTYVRPTNTLTDVDTNLSNIASKTLDASAWVMPKFQEDVVVSSGLDYVTIVDTGNLKHADSVDTTGVPVSDGYDSGNYRALFVEIVDAEIDGYSDGSNLRVSSGPRAGERIFGLTRAGASTSPNSVEIEFYSMPINDWSFTSISTYSWEADQPTSINVCYGYRERLDRIDENVLRELLIKGALSDTGAGGGGGGGAGDGLTEEQHKALRHLIHFIDNGPGDGFASGAYQECLPAGSPFPTQIVWYESTAKLQKIVELIITRDSQQKPIVEEWRMYDEGGIVVISSVIDTITYSGVVEACRERDIFTTGDSGLVAVPPATNLPAPQGSLIYYDGSQWTSLDPGLSGQILQTQGSSADPIWVDNTGGGGAVDGYITVKSDGYEVSDEINCINFNSGLDVVDDGYNQVTIRVMNEFVAQDEVGRSVFDTAAFTDYTTLTINESGIYDMHISFNWTTSSTTVGFFEARLVRDGIPYNLGSFDFIDPNFPLIQDRPVVAARDTQFCVANMRVYVGNSGAEFTLQFRHNGGGEFADIWNGNLRADFVTDIDLIDQIDDTTQLIRLRADRGTMYDQVNDTEWWIDVFTGRYFDDDGSSILGCNYNLDGWSAGIPTQTFTGSVPGFHADFDRYTSSSNDYTILGILDQANTSTLNQNIFEANSTLGLQARSGSGTDALGYVDGSGFNSFSNGTAQTGQQALLCVFDSSNSTVSVYRDGVFVDSASYTSTTLEGEIGIGNFHNGSFPLSSGTELAEVALWDKALNSSERANVWSYVSSRYGL